MTTSTTTGRGKFTPVPFTYTGTDGKDYTWAGRGRRPATLAAVEAATGKVARMVEGKWTWVAAETKVASAAG